MLPVCPRVVVVSGSPEPGSRSERLAQWCVRAIATRGAITSLFLGADLQLPFYRPAIRPGPPAQRLLSALASSDGLILISPVYHGSLTGLLKNALDYANELAGQSRPFLDGRSVGCIALGSGIQGGSSTLGTLRSIAHALRAWPTPLGVVVSPGDAMPDGPGPLMDDGVANQLDVLIDQVLWHGRLRAGTEIPARGAPATLSAAISAAGRAGDVP